MDKLLSKLNYKGQKRIVIINAEKSFTASLSRILKDVIIDKDIDPRFPYDFIVLFVKNASEIEPLASYALHNLITDGTLWFCYPKKSSEKYSSDIDRNHGWDALNDLDFHGIRLVSVDEDWSAIRFRNSKFIRSFSKKTFK